MCLYFYLFVLTLYWLQFLNEGPNGIIRINVKPRIIQKLLKNLKIMYLLILIDGMCLYFYSFIVLLIMALY